MRVQLQKWKFGILLVLAALSHTNYSHEIKSFYGLIKLEKAHTILTV